jgi:hypothetical protein
LLVRSFVINPNQNHYKDFFPIPTRKRNALDPFKEYAKEYSKVYNEKNRDNISFTVTEYDDEMDDFINTEDQIYFDENSFSGYLFKKFYPPLEQVNDTIIN